MQPPTEDAAVEGTNHSSGNSAICLGVVCKIRNRRKTHDEPVSFGIPLSKGKWLQLPDFTRLVAPDGAEHPVQLSPMSHWSDGSIRWLLVDSMISFEDEANGEWRVVCDRSTDHAGQHCESNDHANWDSSTARQLFAQSKWKLVDRRGCEHSPKLLPPEQEVTGPVRTTTLINGHFPEFAGLRLTIRWSFYAWTGLARCEVTLHNSRRARHRGGLWDLGDPGSHLFQDFSYHLQLTDNSPASLSLKVAPEQPGVSAHAGIHLYQDSSGGENWRSAAHINRDGIVPCRFRGYQLRADQEHSSGLRASPIVDIRTDRLQLTAAFPNFWQQFPKAIETSAGNLRIGLFPHEWNDLHELQGGEQKTHVFWLDCRPAASPTADLSWALSPTIFQPSVESCEQAGVATILQPPPSWAHDNLCELLAGALDGPNSIASKRDRVDEYGWRNFGDVFADHEQTHYTAAEPLVSHYNNQFDMLRGFLLQSLRTNNGRWFDLADLLARHVIDIDIYHTTADRAAYNGGMFWFTDHYLHAQTSSHRTYSKKNRPDDGGDYGGGPGSEHNFTSGLLLYYFLTGNPQARDAVLSLANWVIAMEDGRRTILGILDDGPTGLATVGYSKPGRGGANSINALLDAWLLTHDSAYLQFSEQLIRRCVHPLEDVADYDLLNVEAEWSYTMFLVSLHKYLKCKEEAEHLDAMYQYARQTLVAFGKWMLESERPYFDQVDKLEYPTEAWAAQELRKANALRLAAQYVDGPLQAKMLDRGDELANRAWHDLNRFDTRFSARSVALVMTEGLTDCALRARSKSELKDTSIAIEFANRNDFATQVERVKSSLLSPRRWGELAARLTNSARRRYTVGQRHDTLAQDARTMHNKLTPK